jgi:Protein of unknown function (DUF1579)
MREVGAAILALALCATPALAQHSGAPSGVPKKECLSDADRELIGKLKALNRPTTEKDPPPPFNPDYFVGTWTMEYDGPESPLAAEGVHNGTLTVKHVDGCFYEGELDAKGPGGAYKTKIQIMYDPAAKYLTWIETDSRGYTLFKPGTIGADSGGYFTHYFETQAFKAGGQEIHLKGSTFIASPSNFRIRRSISTAGEAYMNLGEMWFRRKGTV